MNSQSVDAKKTRYFSDFELLEREVSRDLRRLVDLRRERENSQQDGSTVDPRTLGTDIRREDGAERTLRSNSPLPLSRERVLLETHRDVPRVSPRDR